MIKYDEYGKIVISTLNESGVLNERIIKSYDYIKFKNDLERVIDLMIMNEMAHQLYREELKYEINEQLEFITFFNDPNPNSTRTEVVTYSRQYYDSSTGACKALLRKVKTAWSYLNDVERFIIKGLEFDDPTRTDEDITDELMTYKNKYIQYKKSAYIKLGTVLKLNKLDIDPEQKKRDTYEYIRWYQENNERPVI